MEIKLITIGFDEDKSAELDPEKMDTFENMKEEINSKLKGEEN